MVSRSVFVLLAASLSAHAFTGAGSGGGGDAATEMRIDDIRADILKWIGEGGDRGLTLPSGMTYENYERQMRDVLAPHAVVIGAVTLAEEAAATDDELKVVVDGQPKTCRGFTSKKDGLPHILCNTERFAATCEAEQYRLVHHEYAGLAGMERNIGASSDYEISTQITDYLAPQTILRLAVKRVAPSNADERARGFYHLVAGDSTCTPVLFVKNVNNSEVLISRLSTIDGDWSNSNTTDFHTGETNIPWVGNCVYPSFNSCFQLWRHHTFKSAMTMSKETALTQVDKAGNITVSEHARLLDEGLWIPFFYPVIQRTERTQVVKHLDGGDIQYFLNERSHYKASKDQPAGDVNASINCRYR